MKLQLLSSLTTKFRIWLITIFAFFLVSCGGGGPDGTPPANWPKFKLAALTTDNGVVVVTNTDSFDGMVHSATISSGVPSFTYTVDAYNNLVVSIPTQTETLYSQHLSNSYAFYSSTWHYCCWIEVWSGGFAAGTTYSEFGSWELSQMAPYEYGVFSGGNNTQTPFSNMPMGTTQIYVGKVLGEVFNIDSKSTHQLTGDISVFTDFNLATMQVNLTGLTARNVGDNSISTFNDLQMTLKISGNGFTGTSITVSSGVGPAALLATATGQSDGKFYGPLGQELSGVWYLQDGHGNVAIAGFGAQ